MDLSNYNLPLGSDAVRLLDSLVDALADIELEDAESAISAVVSLRSRLASLSAASDAAVALGVGACSTTPTGGVRNAVDESESHVDGVHGRGEDLRAVRHEASAARQRARWLEAKRQLEGIRKAKKAYAKGRSAGRRSKRRRRSR